MPFRRETQNNRLSLIHPDVRLFLALGIGISSIFFQTITSAFVLAIFMIGLGIIVRAQFGLILRRMKHAVPFVVMFTIFLPFFSGSEVLWTVSMYWLRITVYLDGIVFAVNLAIRMIVLIYIFMLFLTSYTLTEFSRVRLLPNILRGSLLIMMNYMPLFFLKNRMLLEAQALRGRDMSSKKSKVLATANVLGTTLVKSFDQSERTFEAMIMRGFGTSVPVGKNHSSFWDAIAIILSVTLIVGIYITCEFIWRFDIWTLIL